MTKKAKVNTTSDGELNPTNASSPLVFISHDSRDADLAEAFGKLLKSVSAGMIKTFRSSDTKGTDGIDYGEEWYKRLMKELQSTSDVVCLFTERSLDRPWILFEAGVAKGKLNTQVTGVALGIPLGRVSSGPFYHFMNMDDSEKALTKLVRQLAARIPSLELDDDVVQAQVAAFKTTEAAILKDLNAGGGKKATKEEEDATSIAKLVEEMKVLPTRISERMSEMGDPYRRRKMRRFHPIMFDELMHMSGEPGDPVGILMAASLIREDAPWLYELAMEVYRAVKTGDAEAIESEMRRLHRFSEISMRGPFMEEFGFGGKEAHLFFMEFPRMLEHMLRQTHGGRKPMKGNRPRPQPPSS